MNHIAEADRAWAYSGVDCGESSCACGGGGWILSDRDVWYACPIHWNGQDHPEYEEPSQEEIDWFNNNCPTVVVDKADDDPDPLVDPNIPF